MPETVYQTISINTGAKNLFRVLHDYEIWVRQFTYPGLGQLYHESGWDWREGNPEVQTLINAHAVPLDESWQNTAFDINPGMNPKQWRVLWDFMRAFSNGLGKGFDTRSFIMRTIEFVNFMTVQKMAFNSIMTALPLALEAAGYVPVKDYINNIDTKNNDAPLLSKDKVRLTGGHTFEGERSGDLVIVKTFDGNSGSPQTQWLFDNPGKTIYDFIDVHKFQFMHAVSVVKTATKEPRIIPFTQNEGRRVLVPVIARLEVAFPFGAVQKVNEWQDPYTIYIK